MALPLRWNERKPIPCLLRSWYDSVLHMHEMERVHELRAQTSGSPTANTDSGAGGGRSIPRHLASGVPVGTGVLSWGMHEDCTPQVS